MLKQEAEDGTRSFADPAIPRRRAGRAGRAPARDSRRAGSTTGAARSCSRRSPTCPNIIRPAPRPRILDAHRRRAGARVVRPGRAVVEFGSGSSTKTPLLLARGRARGLCADRHFGRFPARVRARAGRAISRARGRLPLEADFTRPLPLAARESRRCPSSASFPARRSAT